MKNFTFLMIFSLLAIFATAQEATFDWVETELSDGNNLKKMSINGDIATIVGYGNAFLKSTDIGNSWDTLKLFDPQFNLTDISIKGSVGYIVTNREKLYDAEPDIYANGVILKTTDGGDTWETIESPMFGDGVDSTLSPSADLCYGLDITAVETINDSVAFCAMRWYEYLPSGKDDHGGVFKTTDGGATWINVSGDLGATMSAIVFNGDSGFVGGSKRLFKANANADTLVNIFSAMHGDGSDYIFDIDFVDENEVLITTTSDSIYFSYDGGTTFDKFPGIKGGMDIMKINDSTIVVGGGSNKSYVSTNNGQTWAALGITTSIWEIAGVFNDSINMLAKAAIHKCAIADLVVGNYNWVIQNIGDANLQKAFIADENNITIIGNDAGFFKTSDAGLTWTAQVMPEIPALQVLYEDIDFSGLSNVGDEAYACFNRFKFVDYPSSSDEFDIYWSGGVYYTDDNWETFDDLDIAKIGKADADDITKNPNHESCNGANTSVIELMDDGSVLLWVRWYDYSTDPKTEHSRVFKTTDGGKNWGVITNDFEKNYVRAIESKGDTIYVVGSQILMISYNGGNEFVDLYANLDEGEDDKMFINSVTLGSENQFFLTTSVDSVYMTIDGGVSFTTLSSSKGANDFFMFDYNSWIMMGTTGKSKFTNKGGESWKDCHPGSSIWSIGGIYGDKFYALAKGSVFTNLVENFDLTTSIKEIKLDNELTVRYKPLAIELVSSEHEIERCKVYSITGKLISVADPHNRTYELQRSNFQPGIYILDALIKGKRHTEKIIF